jgi:2-dehydropantoate 2-reductase
MRISVFGVGVVGSIYAARLARAGHDVTLVARGRRMAELQSAGLVLGDALTGETTSLRLPVASHLTDEVDLVVVAIRNADLDDALPQLQRLPKTTSVLFMLNCSLQVERLLGALGPQRTFFAFAGAGGVKDGPLIRYTAVRQQPTTFGPVRGQPDHMPRECATLFSRAGFATSVVPDMEAWLLTHAVLITALCGALYHNGGSSKLLAESRAGLTDMIAGLGEGLAVVAALGFTASPLKLRLLPKLPGFIGRRVLSRLLASDFAALAVDGHANAAPEDMQDLARDCSTMIGASGRAAPVLLRLCNQVDAFVRAGS